MFNTPLFVGNILRLSNIENANRRVVIVPGTPTVRRAAHIYLSLPLLVKKICATNLYRPAQAKNSRSAEDSAEELTPGFVADRKLAPRHKVVKDCLLD
jgi:hypothetical protein